MLSAATKRILKKYDKYAKMLEEYDNTGILPLKKIRRSFTIKHMSYSKLKELSKSKKKSMSDLLDELISSC